MQGGPAEQQQSMVALTVVGSREQLHLVIHVIPVELLVHVTVSPIPVVAVVAEVRVALALLSLNIFQLAGKEQLQQLAPQLLDAPIHLFSRRQTLHLLESHVHSSGRCN